MEWSAPDVRRKASSECLQVVWRLANPPQRSAARKALANASNVVIRQPGRAGWQGGKFVTMRGVIAVFADGLS
jgi:hypothetical protein